MEKNNDGTSNFRYFTMPHIKKTSFDQRNDWSKIVNEFRKISNIYNSAYNNHF